MLTLKRAIAVPAQRELIAAADFSSPTAFAFGCLFDLFGGPCADGKDRETVARTSPHSLSNCELDQLSQYSENHDLSDESANNGLFHTKDVTPNEIH